MQKSGKKPLPPPSLQVNQLDSQSAQNIESVGTLYVMKSRPLKDSVVDSPFKSKDVDGGTQKQNMFPDVRRPAYWFRFT